MLYYRVLICVLITFFILVSDVDAKYRRRRVFKKLVNLFTPKQSTRDHAPTGHYEYTYKPPAEIHHGPKGINYPVYRGPLPQYIYDYWSSGNKYSHLLSGLALYNLGLISTDSKLNLFHGSYNSQPGEICTFRVQYSTSTFEEMIINCAAITSFIATYIPENKKSGDTADTNRLIEPQLISKGDAKFNNDLSKPSLTVGRTLKQFSDMDESIDELRNFMPEVDTQLSKKLSEELDRADKFGDNSDELDRSEQDDDDDTDAFLAKLKENMSQLEDEFLYKKSLSNEQQFWPDTEDSHTVSDATRSTLISLSDNKLAGDLVELQPNMECFVSRYTRENNMTTPVSCELLEEYSNSLNYEYVYNSSVILKSSASIFLVVFICLVQGYKR